MKIGKEVLLTALCVAVLCIPVVATQNLLAVCQASVSAPAYGGTLRIATPTEIQIFNPILNNWGQHGTIYVQLFNRLITMDDNYSIVPDLAESWEVNDNGTKFTFHLVRNATWHDGVPFTSEDVRFYYGLLMGWYPQFWNGSSPTKQRLLLGELTSIETPDAYTVIFNLNKTIHLWSFAAPGQADTLILPKHIWWGMDMTTNPANDRPIGTGPFKFVEYVKGDHYTFEANENYFRGRPYLDKLVHKITLSAVGATMALYAGEIDTTQMVSLGEVPQITASPNYGIKVRDTPETFFLFFDPRDKAIEKYPWLANDDVKLAIREAIDMDSIVSTLLFNATIQPNSFLSPLIKWAYNPNLPPNPAYNSTDAEKLLDNAGYTRGSDGVRFRAGLLTKTLPSDLLSVAEAIKFYLSRVGIGIDLTVLEGATMYSEYYINPDIPPLEMWLDEMTAGPDPDLMIPEYGSSYIPPEGYNALHYNNSRVDALFAHQANINDIDQRRNDFYEIQMLMHDDMLGWPMYSWITVEVWSSDFAGFETHGPQSWYASYAGVYWTKATPSPSPSSPPPYGLYAVIAIVVAAVVVGVGLYMKYRRH